MGSSWYLVCTEMETSNLTYTCFPTKPIYNPPPPVNQLPPPAHQMVIATIELPTRQYHMHSMYALLHKLENDTDKYTTPQRLKTECSPYCCQRISNGQLKLEIDMVEIHATSGKLSL